MKKSFASFVFLFSLFLSVPAWAQSAKDKWSILGEELGSWDNTMWKSPKGGAKVNSKGEIHWVSNDKDWEDFGWDLRGHDLSDYEGIKIVIDPVSSNNPIDAIKLTNGSDPAQWLFRESLPGEYFIYFDGSGRETVWGTVNAMNPKRGFAVFFTVSGKKINKVTRIRSVELLKKGTSKKSDNLTVFNVPLGTTNYRAFVQEDKIFWQRGFSDSFSGWDFTNIDLSEYNRVRVEVAESDKNLNLILCDVNWKNWHCFTRISPVVFEASLSGNGALWIDSDSHSFDLEKGLMVMLQKQDEKTWEAETTTTVKSIRFLKCDEEIEQNINAGDNSFEILNRPIGAIQNNSFFQDNTIFWEKGFGEYKYGWNLSGIDLSEYKGVRIEFEKTELRLELTMTDKNWQKWAAFRGENSNKIEAYFSGEGAAWKWNDFEPLDGEDGILLFLRYYSDKPLKKDKRTIIKNVELIKK